MPASALQPGIMPDVTRPISAAFGNVASSFSYAVVITTPSFAPQYKRLASPRRPRRPARAQRVRCGRSQPPLSATLALVLLADSFIAPDYRRPRTIHPILDGSENRRALLAATASHSSQVPARS